MCVIERRPPRPVVRRGVEPRQLGRDAVRLVRRPDVGGVVGDHAGRRGDRVTDERVVAPSLVATPVEPDAAARVAGAVGARVPERPVVGPRRDPDRLEVRPGIGRAARSRGRSIRTLPDEQAVVTRIALDDRDAVRVGRQLETLHLPRGLVQGHRGPRSEIETGHGRLVPTRARVIARHECDDDVVAVPRRPPTRSGRADPPRSRCRRRGRSGTAGAEHRPACERSGSGIGSAPTTARALQSRPYEPGSAATTSSRPPSFDQATLSHDPRIVAARTGSPPAAGIVYGR